MLQSRISNMNIKNKSILVTGGAGCVGSNIVKKLDGRGAKITVIDNLSAYPFDYLHEYGVGDMESVNFIKGDINDHKLISKLIADNDVVVHAAALADVGACVRNPHDEFQTNVRATQNILEICKKEKNYNKMKKVVCNVPQ